MPRIEWTSGFHRMMYRSSIANEFHRAGTYGTSAQSTTARYSRRSLRSTVHRKEPAAIGPAINARQPAGVGTEQCAQLDRRGRCRAGKQDMRHAHALEIGPMLCRRRADQLTPAITLEVERHRLAAGVQPDEGFVIRRDHGVRWKIPDDGEQLGEIGRNRARLSLPPPPREAPHLVMQISAGDQRREETDGHARTRPAPPDRENEKVEDERQPNRRAARYHHQAVQADSERDRSDDVVEPAYRNPPEYQGLERPRHVGDVDGYRRKTGLPEVRGVIAVAERERRIDEARMRGDPQSPGDRGEQGKQQHDDEPAALRPPPPPPSRQQETESTRDDRDADGSRQQRERARRPGDPGREFAIDRKSTRLNS